MIEEEIRAVAGWDGTGLVSTGWLAEHLDDPALRIFDATTHLIPAASNPPKVQSGRADYEAAHIPGGAFLDLAGELSDCSSPLNFTMPTAEVLAAALGGAGVEQGSRLVIYSATTPMWATRVWWMLRSCGFDEAAVLDGGLAKWRREGQPVEAGARSYAPARLVPTPRPELWADRLAVLEAIGTDSVCTINALPAATHRGDTPTTYARLGHIPGSRNVPFDSLLEPDGVFRKDAELRAVLGRVGAFERDRAICYCGGGIAATMTALALVRLGHPSVAVYDGSMSEWSRDPSLPMELGRDQEPRS